MDEHELDQKIDKALAEAPDFHLPVLFADKLVTMIQTKHQASRKWEIFWIAFAGFLFVVAIGVSVYLTGFKPSFSAFPFLNNYVGLIVFGVFFIGLLNWLERRFFRTKSLTT